MLVRISVVWYIQTLLAWGAEVKALDTDITLPDIPLTGLFSTDPSDKIVDKVDPTEKDKPFESSTVIAVVVALTIRPPLLSPD